MIGTTIGNYVIRSKIGEGGMGAVYVAEHARLGRRVAVKVLLPHMGRDPQVVARFFNEAKAATEIKNEHIIDVLDFGELPDGSSYIVMEWLEGRSLADVIAHERMSVPRAVHVAEGIAKALSAAHAHGIVHRDLKPDNVFLVTRHGDADFVKVLDFGIAKLTQDAGDVRTQTGAVMGTPLYMSPEQINGTNVDQRTDVYALGIMLFQMLTGTLPFQTTTLTELLLAHATKTPPPLRSVDPSVPPAIESAVLRALEKDPARRFASVDELARALSAPDAGPVSSLASTGYASTGYASAPQAMPIAPPRVSIGPLPFVIGGAALVVLVGVAGVLVAMRQTSPAPVASVASAAPLEPETTAAVATTAPVPSATASAATATTDRWTLASTDCPPGSMPVSVETTHDGLTITSRAKGYPDSVGTTTADGNFRVGNAAGTCTGKGTPRVVTETCTNKLGMSCHATYHRAD